MRNSIYLRQAEIRDAKFLWNLRNDKDIRNIFFESSSIPYSKHLSWLKDKLASPGACIFIIKNLQDKRIGYVRFEKEKSNIWKISAAIISKLQGRGFGRRAIKMGCRRLFKIANVKKVIAYVLKNNRASINAFQKAGFVLKKNMRINGKNIFLFEMENYLK